MVLVFCGGDTGIIMKSNVNHPAGQGPTLFVSNLLCTEPGSDLGMSGIYMRDLYTCRLASVIETYYSHYLLANSYARRATFRYTQCARATKSNNR